MAGHFLGLDLRESGGRAVVVDREGTVVRRVRFDVSTPMPPDFAAGADGIGMAHLAQAEASAVEVALKLPVTRCAPGDAAIVAESWIGPARGAQHAICLVVGEQVLAGILLDGRPWRGAHGHAGAAAWLALNPVERQDYRRFGSLAAEVSNRGIARLLAWRVQAGDESAVAPEGSDLDAITAEQVYQGARDGDGVAISVVRDTAKYVGMACANLAIAVDPEVVVVTGAQAQAADLLLEPVRQEFARRVPPNLVKKIRLDFSPLAGESIAIGAARIAMLAQA